MTISRELIVRRMALISPYDLTVFLLCQIVITGDFSKQQVLSPCAQNANFITVGALTLCTPWFAGA
jgi:hypothetical protein